MHLRLMSKWVKSNGTVRKLYPLNPGEDNTWAISGSNDIQNLIPTARVVQKLQTNQKNTIKLLSMSLDIDQSAIYLILVLFNSGSVLITKCI